MKYSIPGLLTFAMLFLTLAVSAESNGPAVTDFPAVTSMTFSIEGVAVDKIGNVYVSAANSGQIWKFSPDGFAELFADLGASQQAGLAVDAKGDLYVAVSSSTNRGVWCIDKKGGITHIPGTEAIACPNGLAFDQRGNLYVTESYSITKGAYDKGGIWRIVPGEDAKLWLRDDLLTGMGIVLPFPCGANGIAFYHGDLYVVNTDKGLIVRVPVMPDGDPGIVHVWAKLEETHAFPKVPFVMGDGLALDVQGNVYVAVVSRLAVVRIRAVDKVQETLVSRMPNLDNSPLLPLDTPASLAFGTGKGGRAVLFVTNLGWYFRNPGLVKIDLDIPGLPLP